MRTSPGDCLAHEREVTHVRIGSPQLSVDRYSGAPGVRGTAPSTLRKVPLRQNQDPEPPEKQDGLDWKRAALLGLTLAGGVLAARNGPAIMESAGQMTRSIDELSQDNWERLIGPRVWDSEVEVTPGVHSNRVPAQTVAEARERVGELTFLDIDPFVASVANAVDARNAPSVKGERTVRLHVPGYNKRYEVKLGLPNGPGAPIVVLLPGIYGDAGGAQTKALKADMVARGMNYMVIPNALGPESMKDAPENHPGNPRLEAMMAYDILTQMADAYPEHFQQVSVAGYSYGGLLGANLVRYEEELAEAVPGARRLINGSLVAISPAENLSDSMQELDGLRVHYEDGQGGSVIWNGLKYRRHVRQYGYDNFLESDLAQRTEGSNNTEIKLADLYGSRNGMKDMIDRVDQQFDHNQLPLNRPGAPRPGRGRGGNDARYRRVQAEHRRALDDATYVDFRDQWFAKDGWLQRQQMTPDEMAAEYSYGNAMGVIDDTPVLTLLSADDYILNDTNVETYRNFERNPGPEEVTRVFETGGHVGILFNPEVRETMADFAFHPPTFEKTEEAPETPEQPGDPAEKGQKASPLMK